MKSIRITTPVARLVYPNFFEPKRFKKQGKEMGEPMYSCTLLFKKDMNLKDLISKITEAGNLVFGSKDQWPSDLKMPIKNGDKHKNKNYHGCYYLTCKSKSRPAIYRRDETIIGDENKNEIYSGCYGHGIISAMVTEMAGNHYISLYLNGFQKSDDGDRIASGVDLSRDLVKYDKEIKKSDDLDFDLENEEIPF